MYTQDLNNALAYENERRNDELRAAQECCRVNQLLPNRPDKRNKGFQTVLLNILVAVLAFSRAR